MAWRFRTIVLALLIACGVLCFQRAGRCAPGAAVTSETAPEESPMACAVLAARKVSDANQFWRLREAAQTVGPERREEAVQIIFHTVQVARAGADSRDKYLTLHSAAYSLLRIGARDKALEVATEALALARYYKMPAQETWLLDLFTDLGQADVAAQLLRSGYRGSLVRVVRSYLAAGEKAKALGLLGEALHQARKADPADETGADLEAIARSYAEAGEFDRALDVAERIPATLHPLAFRGEERGSPVRGRILALLELAAQCAKAGQKERACAILSRAHEVARGIAHRYLKSEMTKSVALAYAGAGQCSSRVMLPDDEERPSLDMEKAHGVAGTIEHSLLKAWTLGGIAARQRKLGNREAYLAILTEGVEVALGIAPNSNDAEVCELDYPAITQVAIVLDLVEFYVKGGDRARAAGVLVRAIPIARANRFCEAGARELCAIAGKCHELGQDAQAAEALAEAATIARDPRIESTPTYKAHAWSAIAARYFEIGRDDKAKEAVAQAAAAQPALAAEYRKEPDKRPVSTIEAEQAILALARAKRYKQAFELASRTSDVSIKVFVRNFLGASYVQAGLYEEAIEIARATGTPVEKAELLMLIGAKYPRPSERVSERARQALREIATQLR